MTSLHVMTVSSDTAAAAAGRLEQRQTQGGEGQVGMLGDEVSDDVMDRRWGPLIVAALAYVAVGAWDWTDTVEALARSATATSVKLVPCSLVCTYVCDLHGT